MIIINQAVIYSIGIFMAIQLWINYRYGKAIIELKRK